MSKLVGMQGGEIAGKSFGEKGVLTPARSRRRMGHRLGSPETVYRRRMLRQAAPQPAHALETLRHAAAYLIDSRMFLVNEGSQKAERDAVQVLMCLSRTVFQERSEAIAFGSR